MVAPYKADFGAKKREIGPENTFFWSVIQLFSQKRPTVFQKQSALDHQGQEEVC